MTKAQLPILHGLIITIVSGFYAVLFIFTANQMELNSMLANSTLSSRFWNGWSDFIRNGHMQYVGYTIALLTLVSIITMLIKKHAQYDEFQISILVKLLVVAGVVSILLLPIVIVMLLSDRNYLIETFYLPPCSGSVC